MKFEKKLQKMIDDALLEEYGNEEFLNTLKKQQAEKNKGKKTDKKPFMRKFGLIFVSCCVVLISTVVTSVLFTKPKEAKPGYLQGNEIQADSSVSEMNSAAKFFKINESHLWYVTKTSDSVSNDTLGYIAILNDDVIDYLKVRFVTNKEYDFPCKFTTTKEAPFGNFTIKYFENVIFDTELELYSFECKGIIDTGEEEVYINYEGYSENENSPFLEFLSQMLILK